MIEINGNMYRTIEQNVFTMHSGYPAAVVEGVNTVSGETVAINVNGRWQFVNDQLNDK